VRGKKKLLSLRERKNSRRHILSTNGEEENEKNKVILEEIDKFFRKKEKKSFFAPFDTPALSPDQSSLCRERRIGVSRRDS